MESWKETIYDSFLENIYDKGIKKIYIKDIKIIIGNIWFVHENKKIDFLNLTNLILKNSNKKFFTFKELYRVLERWEYGEYILPYMI